MHQGESQATTDHDTIRKWAEERGGHPAAVTATKGDDGAGILRIEFDERTERGGDELTPISWEEFFDTFEDRGLAFLYQDKTKDGQTSRFFKLVSRDDGGRRH